jgi:hypothetical protein
MIDMERSQKRQKTAALHNVAAILSAGIFVCALECGGAPPLSQPDNPAHLLRFLL